MSRRHPEDVAPWVVFPQEGQGIERNRRSDSTNGFRPLSPSCTLTAVGNEIPLSSPVRGGSWGLQRKAGRCCVSAWEDEHQSGRRETGILVPPSWLLFVGRGSLGSFGAFSAGVSSIPGHLPLRGERSGMPQAGGGGSCDGGVGVSRLQVCSCCWTWGNGGKLSLKGSESCCCTEAHLSTFWG